MKRRGFLGALIALCTLLAVSAQAQEIPARSPLGIDYMALTEGDAQLSAILLAGEAEWMANANERYRSLDLWKATCEQVASEKIAKRALEKLTSYTPKMLSSFIDLPKDRYPLLQAIGGLAESREGLAESEDMLRRAQEIAEALGVKQ